MIPNLIMTNEVLLNDYILFCNFPVLLQARPFHPPCIRNQALSWEAPTARDQRRANLDSHNSRSTTFNNSSSNNSLRSRRSQQVMASTLSSLSSLDTQVQGNNRASKHLRSSHSLLAIPLRANHFNSQPSSSHHSSSLTQLLNHNRHSSRNSRLLLLYALSRPPLRLRSHFRVRPLRQLHRSRAIRSPKLFQT
jgi:hypothetical protein